MSAPVPIRRPLHCVVLDPDETRREALVAAIHARGHEATGYDDSALAHEAAAALADVFFVTTAVGADALCDIVDRVLGGAAIVAPSVIVFGPLPPHAAFALARSGASIYIEADGPGEVIASHIPCLDAPPPALDPIVRAYIGRQSLPELRRAFRDAMVRQALVFANGSSSKAARLLRVSRQAIQHMMREG